MSEHIEVTIQAVVIPDTPPLTPYQQVATEFMEAFEKMIVVIPKLEELTATKVVRANLNVPVAFCGTAISAVAQVPELDSTKKFDSKLNLDRLQYLQAFRPLYDTTQGFVNRLSHILMTVKSELVGDSLQVYRMAKSLASDKRSPVIEAHVAALKRDLNRRTLTKAERDRRKAEKLAKAVKAFLALGEEKEVKAA
jgi:hypothetical protein